MHAIQQDLTGLSRYTGGELAEMTNNIAARGNISPEHVVLGEILDVLGLYLSARGSPGGEFVYSEPGYTALVDAVAPVRGVVVGVPLNERLEKDLPAISGKLSERARAVYLFNPHNPCGAVSEPGQFIDLVRAYARDRRPSW